MKDVRTTAVFAALTCAVLVLGLIAGGPAIAADYAPLNCAAARSSAERAICGSYLIGQMEARMATLYQWATVFVPMGQRGDIADAQRAFIKTREACRGRIDCIANAYDARIKQLEAVMQNVASKGPF